MAHIRGKLTRFTREELEIAVADATMSGRVYASTGEREEPGPFVERAIQHAIDAVLYHRAMQQRDRRRKSSSTPTGAPHDAR